MENYCSDPTAPCTIKTPACGDLAGIFISCGSKPYIHTDRRADIIESLQQRSSMRTCSVRGLTSSMCTRRLNANASACKHRVQHKFSDGQKHHSYFSGHPSTTFPGPGGVYGPTRGWQRSVVTSLSLTGSVLNHNHTVTTRRPGARWACHYAGHNTNISPVLSLYICARGASSGAWAVKVYFWMYSLHSERVAVGARQLWRQRVIVARQADRPKMAELTGTRRAGEVCTCTR